MRPIFPNNYLPQRPTNRNFYVTSPHTFQLQLEGEASVESAFKVLRTVQNNGFENRELRSNIQDEKIQLSSQPLSAEESNYLFGLFRLNLGNISSFALQREHLAPQDYSLAWRFENEIEVEIEVCKHGVSSSTYAGVFVPEVKGSVSTLTSCTISSSSPVVPAFGGLKTSVDLTSTSTVFTAYKGEVYVARIDGGILKFDRMALSASRVYSLSALGSVSTDCLELLWIGSFCGRIVVAASSNANARIYSLDLVTGSVSIVRSVGVGSIPMGVSGLEVADTLIVSNLTSAPIAIYPNFQSEAIALHPTIAKVSQLTLWRGEVWGLGRSVAGSAVAVSAPPSKPRFKVRHTFSSDSTGVDGFIYGTERRLVVSFRPSSVTPQAVFVKRPSQEFEALGGSFPLLSSPAQVTPFLGSYLVFARDTGAKLWDLEGVSDPELTGSSSGSHNWYLYHSNAVFFSNSPLEIQVCQIQPESNDTGAILTTLLEFKHDDGTDYRFTDCDRTVRYASRVFTPTPGFSVSSLRMTSNLQPETCEVKFNKVKREEYDFINENLVKNSEYQHTNVNILRVQLDAQTTSGKLFRQEGAGWVVGEVKSSDTELTMELRGASQRLQNKAYQKTSPFCRHSFGDNRCRFDVPATAKVFTVISVTSDSEIVCSCATPVSGADFSNGVLVWDTGANSPRIRSDIQEGSGSGTTGIGFTLWSPAPRPIAIGDTFTAYWGCNRSLAQCNDRGNVLNFGGFPWVPGVNYLIAGTNLRESE